MIVSTPIFLMFEEKLPEDASRAVIEAIKETFQDADTYNKLQSVFNCGVWRPEGYLKNGQYVPYMSIDWYLQHAQEDTRPYRINSDIILEDLFEGKSRIKETETCLIVLVLTRELYSNEKSSVIGQTRVNTGMVVSIDSFKDFNPYERFECIKTVALHEFGHLFGLPSSNRAGTRNNSMEIHCANECIMEEVQNEPQGWVTRTEKRINSSLGSPYCDTCLQELRKNLS